MFSGDQLQSSKDHISSFTNEHADIKQLPFPYKIDIPQGSGGHVIFKAIPVPVGEVPNISGGTRPSYAHYESGANSHEKFEDPKDGQGQTPHIIHTGRQELHIVLHPIPIGDPHSAANGQALHFVPVHLNSNQTASGQYPFMFPVAPKTSESHEKQSSPPEGYDEEYYPSNNNSDRIDLRKHRHEDSSASSSSETTDGKHSSRVTWVLRQETKPSRRKDAKPFDNEAGGSIPRISSVNFQDSRDQDKSTLKLNGQYIDLVQLKEDLRHGTPSVDTF
ncbi:uncharacterized protein CEXT_222611 [Caerostris extrusa]|uniref:Uncharacterized protein n=1 Tax=Caerostris extrusa TaxID=172846 RepID=A0AAV4QBW7_CAEEX|nr:uncharacterized protein CEXT_222611 [Caerostris extrusa]